MNGKVEKKGKQMDGQKDILAIWIFGNKYTDDIVHIHIYIFIYIKYIYIYKVK